MTKTEHLMLKSQLALVEAQIEQCRDMGGTYLDLQEAADQIRALLTEQSEQNVGLREAVRQLNERGECMGCGGSGYTSAPCPDDVPASMRPIGVSPCFLCHGTGLAPEPVEQRVSITAPIKGRDSVTWSFCGHEVALADDTPCPFCERDIAEEKLAKLVGLVKDLCKLLGFYNADVVLRPQAAALFAYLNELEGGE